MNIKPCAIISMICIIFILFVTGGCTGLITKSKKTFMFDNFNYTTVENLEAHGWKVRTVKGWPGIPGALWLKENVSFPIDPQNTSNRFLRMTSVIGPAVSQTQICHERKYLEGTYAARVRFTNDQLETAGGNMGKIEVVKSFYAITPYSKPLDPAYSEIDFEYLPNGGWGLPPLTLMNTTWETVQIEPWLAKNSTNNHSIDYEGWHILVIQAANGKVNYFMDNQLLTTHKKPNYPDSPMSINFNLWFIMNNNPLPEETCTFIEEIDWVFYAQNVVMELTDVIKQVYDLHSKQIAFYDSVPKWNPPLDCPCDL